MAPNTKLAIAVSWVNEAQCEEREFCEQYTNKTLLPSYGHLAKVCRVSLFHN